MADVSKHEFNEVFSGSSSVPRLNIRRSSSSGDVRQLPTLRSPLARRRPNRVTVCGSNVLALRPIALRLQADRHLSVPAASQHPLSPLGSSHFGTPVFTAGNERPLSPQRRRAYSVKSKSPSPDPLASWVRNAPQLKESKRTAADGSSANTNTHDRSRVRSFSYVLNWAG